MLTEDENRTLTQVGPGTPMGDLLRRYWQPVAAVGELDAQPAKRVPILGEQLVLYRDRGGRFGLIDSRCAHRLTDLSYGLVEEYGLRCFLHGWLYNEEGQCLDQPFEPEPFCREIKLTAYPVQVKAGLVWAYLGPPPAPLVPDWEPFSREDGLVQIVFVELPCNWLQCHENSLDPIDIERYYTHLSSGAQDGFILPEPGLDFRVDEFEHGFVYRRAAGDGPARHGWTIGRTSLWPNGVFSGDDRSCHFEWRVPLTDTSTLTVYWFYDRAADDRKLPEEERFVHWTAPVKDESGRIIDTHALNRNFAIWLHQAPIIDRTNEFLVESDRGLVLLRNKYFSQIERLSDGAEPKALVRDPAANQRLALPFSAPRRQADAPAPAESFPYLAGQPPEAEALYKRIVLGQIDDVPSPEP
jgi:5,5'-dehydrodivanillate O-demethylase